MIVPKHLNPICFTVTWVDVLFLGVKNAFILPFQLFAYPAPWRSRNEHSKLMIPIAIAISGAEQSSAALHSTCVAWH
jgi:hypothetical protein